MYYVRIEKPNQIDSSKTKEFIKSLIVSGVKTNKILLIFEFVAPSEVLNEIVAKFQVLKNRIAFETRG